MFVVAIIWFLFKFTFSIIKNTDIVENVLNITATLGLVWTLRLDLQGAFRPDKKIPPVQILQEEHHFGLHDAVCGAPLVFRPYRCLLLCVDKIHGAPKNVLWHRFRAELLHSIELLPFQVFR